MESTLIHLEMEDGSTLYIQSLKIDPENDGDEILASSGRKSVVKAAECLDKALPQVTTFSGKMKERIQKDLKPDEIELEFSVGFTGEIPIISAGAEAGITVRLVWKKDEKKEKTS